MIGGRISRIAAAACALVATALYDRHVAPRAPRLPDRLRRTLEGLGPVFVKLGQVLSLHEDIFSPAIIQQLRQLQEHSPPFPSDQARAEIERSLGKPITVLFHSFDEVPFAAASMAQVHHAVLPGGKAVVVKVRRPHITAQIDQDMRSLLRLVWLASHVSRRLAALQPIQLVKETWTNLQREVDFLQEARNVERFAAAFNNSETVYIPAVYAKLSSASVLTQDQSDGVHIGDASIGMRGPKIARTLLNCYLHQFFVVGAFHGDPHPGNLFIMADGRLCFHDFGLIGSLDRHNRDAFAAYLQGFVYADADWMLDAAIDLGLLASTIDRRAFTSGIEEILVDFDSRPLKNWSIAEAFTRVAQLGHSGDMRVPRTLLVLMRALFILESVLRQLDPELNVIDTLLQHGEAATQQALQSKSKAALWARLRYESLLLARDAPDSVASALHRLRGQGRAPASLASAETSYMLSIAIERAGNRLSLAIVILTLYVAGSLLMVWGTGPRPFDAMRLLATVLFGVALWLTVRLLRKIARSAEP